MAQTVAVLGNPPALQGTDTRCSEMPAGQHANWPDTNTQFAGDTFGN
jgi:hypothetical protein